MAERYSARRSVMRQALKVGALTIGMAISAAPAEAHLKNKHERAVLEAQQLVQYNVRHGRLVEYTGNWDVVQPGKKTAVPLVMNVDGERRYFNLTNVSGDLSQAKVKTIPKKSLYIQEGRYIFPGLIARQPNVAGMPETVSSDGEPDVARRHIVSNHGVVQVNETGDPYVHVTFADGAQAALPAAQTENYNTTSQVIVG